MSWPTPQEYNEAIQNPAQNFSDDELKKGSVELTRFGIPRAQSGYFANVYHMRCGKRSFAVRCFLHSLSDERARYEILSQVLAKHPIDYFVPFEFLAQGVRIGGGWFPVVKMEWVQGDTLDTFVRKNVHDSQLLMQLAENFKQMVRELQRIGIAHGDLQHGNILVVDGKLKLVDYDGLFIDQLEPLGTAELGHPNYQHPGRNHMHFNSKLDNFSAWSIYTGLRCLSLDSSLLDKLYGADECVLFRATDYRRPTKSRTFLRLEAHEVQEISDRCKIFRSLLDIDVDSIPSIDTELAVPQSLPEIVPDPETHEVIVNAPAPPPLPVSQNPALVRAQALDWPTLNDYAKAIGLPKYVFSDPLLQGAKLHDAKGSVEVGKNGVIFQMKTSDGKELAVKCFLRRDDMREWRYKLLRDFVLKHALNPSNVMGFIVPFTYMQEGVRIRGNWYPVLIYEWVRGERLDKYIQSSMKSMWGSFVLPNILPVYRRMITSMERLGIAHGDLDPSNMIVRTDGSIALIDYDAMYVPNSEERIAPELGNKDYQHPNRTEKDWGKHIQNFPAWVIDTALVTICSDIGLARRCRPNNRPLLFTATDFTVPETSNAFAYIDMQRNQMVRTNGKLLKKFLDLPLAEIPPMRNGKTPNEFVTQHDLTPSLAEAPFLVHLYDKRAQQRIIYTAVYSIGILSLPILFTIMSLGFARELNYYQAVCSMATWILMFEFCMFVSEAKLADSMPFIRVDKLLTEDKPLTPGVIDYKSLPLAKQRQLNIRPELTFAMSAASAVVSTIYVCLTVWCMTPLMLFLVMTAGLFYTAYIRVVRKPILKHGLNKESIEAATTLTSLYALRNPNSFTLRPQETLANFFYNWVVILAISPLGWFVILGLSALISRVYQGIGWLHNQLTRPNAQQLPQPSRPSGDR